MFIYSNLHIKGEVGEVKNGVKKLYAKKFMITPSSSLLLLIYFMCIYIHPPTPMCYKLLKMKELIGCRFAF